MGDCKRCGGTQKLRSGNHCPSCTHVIEWRAPRYAASGRAIPGLHVVACSCGWRHSETSRQNALGRAAKMRAAVAAHLRGATGSTPPEHP